MTREALLKASITEFQDSINNAEVWECDRVTNSGGYIYIIKKKSKPLSCAIHVAGAVKQDQQLGKFETQSVMINTREQLDTNAIVIYKDIIIALTGNANYNETMGQWHYMGVMAYEAISRRFMVADERNVQEILGASSLPIFIDLADEYPIVPHIFESKSANKYVLVRCDENEGLELGGTIDYDNAGYLRQPKSDRVTLSFVNFNRNEMLRELHRIQEKSLEPTAKFGFNTPINIENAEIYQVAFNWRASVYNADFVINYYLTQEKDKFTPYDDGQTLRIKKVIYEALRTL